MIKRKLLHLLEQEARSYRKSALKSIRQNILSTSLSKIELSDLEKNIARETMQKFIDAALVCFINNVAIGQGINLGLKTTHIAD